MTAFDERLKAIVGPQGWKTDAEELEPHVTEWRGVYVGKARILVAPGTTQEVSQVVRACAEAGVAVVAQGGNTGMCGGAVPDESGEQVLLSLGRLNRIRNLDRLNYSIEVDAGCVLADVQSAAREAGRYFPLSLGAEGSCQIGGNLATNAGGVNVIRYGTVRALVLGLEVVLADGTIIDGLRALRKDTAGYDLKQLFVGSEGTLGIITAATLRLFPDPGETATALVAIRDSGDAVQLLAELRGQLGDRIEAFELVSRQIFDSVEQAIPGARVPMSERHPWYVLMEVATDGNAEILEAALMTVLEKELVVDAVLAKNTSEADKLWHLRHSIAEAERKLGKAIKHDISVPISRMQEFLRRGDQILEELRPDATLLAFGHVGDGNIHYNVRLPGSLAGEERAAAGEQISVAILDLVSELGGSFSAEHGVGRAKSEHLKRYRGGPEYELMRQLKKSLDPLNILNPGKVF